jgi:hypothetical protein
MKILRRYKDLLLWLPILLICSSVFTYLVTTFLYLMQNSISVLNDTVLQMNVTSPTRWADLQKLIGSALGAYLATIVACRLNERARIRFYRAAPDGNISPLAGLRTYFTGSWLLDLLILLLLPGAAFLLGYFVSSLELLRSLAPLHNAALPLFGLPGALVFGTLWPLPAVLWGVLREQNAWRVRVFTSLHGREDVE